MKLTHATVGQMTAQSLVHLARQRFNALAMLALAVVFIWFFQVTKHDQALINVNPFAEDPFDSTGSFATIFAVSIAIICLFSAFVSRRALTAERQLVILRRQILGSLAIVTTLVLDMVALARYPGLWLGHPGGEMLLLLVTLFFIATISFSLYLYFSFRGQIGSASRRDKVIAAICWIAAAGLEVLLPGNLHDQGIPGAVAAILVGVVALFAIMRTTAVVVVPYPRSELKAGRRYWWWQALVFGLLVGFVISQIEGLAESGSLGQFSLITVFFTLVGGGGVFIGYAFLARPLGFYGVREKQVGGTPPLVSTDI